MNMPTRDELIEILQSTPAGKSTVPTVDASEFFVKPSGFDETDMLDKFHWVLRVQLRSYDEDVWCVTDGAYELSSAGNWNLVDRKIRRFHRFPLQEALSRAQAIVDTRTMNGKTFAQAVDWVNERRTERAQADG